jgi:hypothetical protein
MNKYIRNALLFAALCAVAGVGACADRNQKADPAGPSWECGGYLGGGGGKQQDTTRVCAEATAPPTDSI